MEEHLLVLYLEGPLFMLSEFEENGAAKLLLLLWRTWHVGNSFTHNSGFLCKMLPFETDNMAQFTVLNSQPSKLWMCSQQSIEEVLFIKRMAYMYPNLLQCFLSLTNSPPSKRNVSNLT
ncbi:unnamed protein product [Urochloa humidicola]